MKRTIFRNDKVILLKEYDKLKQVGNTYEVGGITESAIVLREVTDKTAVAAVAIEDFDNYFAKIENVGRKFTPWTGIANPNDDLIAFYRTNHKKVQVRIFDGNINNYIKGEASCSKGDEFNLYFGIRLAMARAIDKFYRQVALPQNGEEYLTIRKNFKQNKALIKNMLASLEPKELKNQEVTEQKSTEV